MASVCHALWARGCAVPGGRTPPLDEVRDAVLRDWSAEERTRRMKAQLESLLSRYSVTVETVPAVPK